MWYKRYKDDICSTSAALVLITDGALSLLLVTVLYWQRSNYDQSQLTHAESQNCPVQGTSAMNLITGYSVSVNWKPGGFQWLLSFCSLAQSTTVDHQYRCVFVTDCSLHLLELHLSCLEYEWLYTRSVGIMILSGTRMALNFHSSIVFCLNISFFLSQIMDSIATSF